MNYTATIPLLFVKVDETGTPGKLSKNVGNPRCHDPATSRATQTSYGVPTNSPVKGLIGRTNAIESPRRYKIPGQQGIYRYVKTDTQKKGRWFSRRNSESKIGCEMR